MEGLVAKRSACRGAFTQACNRIEESLREASTVQNVEILKTQLRSKYERLEAVQEEISAFILTDKGLVSTFEEDFGRAEKYRDKYDALSINLDKMTAKVKEVVTERRKFQLPTIKLTAFSGDPREYLGFWAQFQKIHEDQQIAEEDKFQYLLQAVIPDSKAARLVQSIPPTRDNYPKVIEQLRDRFGRDDLLVQIFVRDLLAMITKNIASGNKKCDLAELYDAIESKLSALESLGRTKEKYADFLAPLVESCLPETVLRAWERSRSSDDSAVRSLEQLMLFLRNEVKGEEMILLARSGLGAQRTSIRTTQNSYHDMPTISALVDTSDMAAGKRTYLCIFCNKTHISANCFSARRMSLEDRKKVVMKHRACFKCLRVGHTARKCRVKVQCFKCDRSHVTLMCAEGETSIKESVSGTLSTNVLASQCRNNVFLQTLMIMVAFRDKELVIRCLLDSGCQRSYISKRVIEVLGIPYKQKQTISHGLFGGRETSPRTHFVYDLQLKSLDGTYACNIEVLSEGKICGAVPRVSDISTIIELKERGIVIPDLNSQESEISALIGADVIGNLITGTSLRLNSGLVVLQTRLGNVLFGKVKAMPFDNCIESVPASSESLYCKSYSVLSLYSCASFDLSDLWNLENIGITHPVEDNKRKVAYADTVNSFKEILTVLPNGRYQVSLPFKSELKLPTNRNLVSGRHRNMCLRAIQGSYLNDYVNVFKEWEELGIVERVPKEELDLGYHYLAHRPIIRHSSQTMKIRPVFDASARAGYGPSLNDLLIRGPNLIELIPDILDRFRLYPVGLSSDIEKAFLQIVIAPQHRNYLRFLWPTIDEEVVYRHCRLVFGLSPSPFLLAASLSHLLDSASPELNPVVQKLRHSFYVDNCVTGVSNVHEQEYFILKATEILAERCFNLRGWESNVPSRFVRSSGVTSLLGVLWDLERDTLKCSVDIHLDKEPTKRKVLAAVQRIFDPIGILCPSTLVPKIMLQEMWKAKVGWDNLLPENFQALFLKWVEEAESLRTVEVPRYLNVNESSELHVFVDACRTSYAACIFVRTETSLGVKVQLIRAKTRVAPIKELTIPRLELMACCIGARLAHAVKNALELPKLNLVFWSDSMVALWWLLKKGSWSVFVENRIKEVKQLFPNEVWRHVPGQQNPADLLSRGCSPQLLGESRWWEGPSWLYEPCDRWPKNELVCQESSINLERGKVQLCGIGLIEDTIPWYAVRFSGFLSIVRCVGWICRFAHNSRGSRENRRSGELSTLEICFAERTLIRMIQKQYFPEACNEVVVGTFRDEDGLLRVKTRLTQRQDDPVFKFPILLPGKCVFTTRLIEHFHKINCHAGTQMLLNILREQYWILRGRKMVRDIVRHCVKCKRYTAKSMDSIPVALPADRVSDCAVFEVVGIDFAGPLFLKGGEKVWLALFTCATYRALHLELVTSLSADAFILSLRRFIARRGRPRIIYSDNGTNFRGTHNELRALDWQKIQRDAYAHRIHWRFNPPTAAWWGGFWERLVRTVKELLRRTLGHSVLNFEELHTIICDCESVVNSRPLTYLSESPEDWVPLTPAMFLRENYDARVPDMDTRDSSSLRKRIRYRWKLLKDLRERFRSEYLGLLVQKAQCKTSSVALKVGEIVLLGDDAKKRGNWPLARVMELIPGKDGVVRTVRVRTKTGTFLRPIQRLFPLEICDNSLDFITDEVSSSDQENVPNRSTFPSQDVDVVRVAGPFRAPVDSSSACAVSSPLESERDARVPMTSVSRYGRVRRAPQRLDLLNQDLYVFASFPAKRGEDVGK